MFTRRVLTTVSGVFALTLCATASAHHGWSGNTQAIEVSGTVVTNVSLAGPHGTMQIRDADGNVWDLTLAPGARTSRAGLKEDVLPMGAEVTIRGMRNDNPERYEVKTRRVSWNGQNFDVYPES